VRIADHGGRCSEGPARRGNARLACRR
jgi:hypothetical protein